MPSGKTHEKVNFFFLHILIFSGIFGLVFYHYGFAGASYPLLFIVGYWFGTYYMSPDLDLKSSVYYRWKWFRPIWHPYQKKFPHRSLWTHGILIGDLIRFFYLFLFLLIPILISTFVMKTSLVDTIIGLSNFINPHTLQIGLFFSGISVASTLHIVSDFWVSFIKRIRKRKSKSSK